MTAYEPMDARRLRYKASRWKMRSPLIHAMRKLLPVAIAAILGLLVYQVVTRTLGARQGTPREAGTAIRMVNPRFLGRDDQGRGYVLTAKSALRDDRDLQRVTLDHPVLVLGAATDAPSRITANSGTWRENGAELALSGDVRVDDGAGYRFASQQALVNTQTNVITGAAPLSGDGPAGQVESNAYSVYDKGDRVIFRNGVRARLNQH